MKLLFSLALVLITLTTFAQAETPKYAITISKFKRYYNANQPDSLFSMFAPGVKAKLPLDKTKELFTNMHTQIGALKKTSFTKYLASTGIYKADYDNVSLLINISLNQDNQIDGIYFNEYKPESSPATSITAPISPSIADPSLTELPVSIKTLAGTLAGSLTIPKDATAKIPVVLIVPGSEPTDRNGNNAPALNTDAFKYLAEGLGKAGIASLRYDKRGVGQSKSSQKEIDSKFTDFVDDAAAWVGMLEQDSRFSKIVVLGYSEGSLAGLIACYSADNVSAFISVAGAGRPGDLVMADQMKSQSPSVSQEFKTILDSLRKGKTVPRVDPALYGIARPSIQPYIISWIPFDPTRVIKKVKLPMLIIQGNNDLHIGISDAELLKKAKSEAVLKIIDGMNHVLKQAPADKEQNLATYTDPALPIKPEVITDITDFIKGLKNR